MYTNPYALTHKDLIDAYREALFKGPQAQTEEAAKSAWSWSSYLAHVIENRLQGLRPSFQPNDLVRIKKGREGMAMVAFPPGIKEINVARVWWGSGSWALEFRHDDLPDGLSFSASDFELVKSGIAS